MNGEGPKRPVGQVILQYEPNTGQFACNSNGLLPIEELGLAQWFIWIRMKNLDKAEQGQILVAPPGSRVTQ